MTYDPLHWMERTGEAVLRDGVLIESREYVAALYESYAADHEWCDGAWLVPGGIQSNAASLSSLGDYCGTAQRVAEELWDRDLESVIGH